MKSKTLASAVRVLTLILLVAGISALAEDRRVQHFSGLINDYSPLSSISGSPWEMHGQWTLDLYPERGTADFSADMTMSGFGKVAATGAVDPTQPLVNPHTHHIKLTNAKITWNMTGCPTYMTPVPTAGFQLNDTVSLLTGNGQIAPFETNPPSSTLQVCITGGTGVQYTVANSNITMMFGGLAATKHFGPQAIHGVVRKAPDEPSRIREIGR